MTAAAAICASAISGFPANATPKTKTPEDASGFVNLTDVVPDAILEVRYYGTYNFIGERIEGYEEPVILLTKEAASALKKASYQLREKGLRFKIYDGYRPQKAVDHFMRWLDEKESIKMKSYFYPELDKNEILPKGYIAKKSGHSRGSTLDLTLFSDLSGKELDMGANFDYFGELSHSTRTEGLTQEQIANRKLLRDVMNENGFEPAEEEWWHFTLKDEPYPDTYFTFPVTSGIVRA
ncbi:MAG: M15 family metallopeptidase [Synergistes sp.]|nr:M15 family metallopeptidase [Synergistes sp.]